MMGHMIGRDFYGSDWNSMPDYMKQMMQNYYGGLSPFGGFLGVMDFVTWALIIVLLIALIRLVWKKGDRQ